MLRIDVNGDRRLQRKLKRMPAINKAATRWALSRTKVTVRKEASQAIRKQYRIKAGDLAEHLFARGPYRDRLEVSIGARGNPIGLVRFSGRQTKRGATFQVRRDRPRQRLRHGFVATMASGHTGIFTRTGQFRVMRRGNYRGKRREVIEERFSLSAPAAFNQIIEPLMPRARAIFAKNLRQQLQYRLRREGLA